MKIMSNRMDRGFQKYQKEFEQKALEVLRSGWYVLGKEVCAFEEEFAQFVGGGGLLRWSCKWPGCTLDCISGIGNWHRR